MNIRKSSEFNIPVLDGLRACAILLVFAAHGGLDRLVPGGFGVTVFFFLSGYLITSLLRLEARNSGTISLRAFYMRRVFRIFPPMYLTVALAFIAGALRILPYSGTPGGLVSAIFYYFNYEDLRHPLIHLLPAGTGVLWSLMIEEHFYFFFPLLYKTFVTKAVSAATQSRTLLVLCGIALIWRVILVFVFRTPLNTLPRWTYSSTDARFDAILWGCLLAIADNPWFGDPSGVLKRYKGAFAVVGLSLIFFSLLYREPHFRETLRYSVQSLALYPIFFYCVASPGKWGVRWLEWRPMRWIGWVSYSLYLVHHSLLLTLPRFLHSPSWLVGSVAFGLATVYALAMRHFVELPLKNFRERITHSLSTPRRTQQGDSTSAAAINASPERA